MNVISCIWNINGRTDSWPTESKIKKTPSDQRLKRRFSSFGKVVLEVIEQSTFFIDDETIPWVAASRHGDAERMIHLFESLIAKEQSSPTVFSLSVHNAIFSLYSIISKNFCSNTALSAGERTFELGLLEAFAMLKKNKAKVGYIYYDAPLESIYNDVMDNIPYTSIIAMILDYEFDTHGILVDHISSLSSEKNPLMDIKIEFINFLTNSKKNYEIPVPGGYFSLKKREYEI